jgi:hypothetical protein
MAIAHLTQRVRWANNKKRSKNNKSPKLCFGDLIIIIIRNGAKTISLQTLFGRLNYDDVPLFNLKRFGFLNIAIGDFLSTELLTFDGWAITVSYYPEYWTVFWFKPRLCRYKEVWSKAMYMCQYTVAFHRHTKHPDNRNRSRCCPRHTWHMFSYKKRMSLTNLCILNNSLISFIAKYIYLLNKCTVKPV